MTTEACAAKRPPNRSTSSNSVPCNRSRAKQPARNGGSIPSAHTHTPVFANLQSERCDDNSISAPHIDAIAGSTTSLSHPTSQPGDLPPLRVQPVFPSYKSVSQQLRIVTVPDTPVNDCGTCAGRARLHEILEMFTYPPRGKRYQLWHINPMRTACVHPQSPD